MSKKLIVVISDDFGFGTAIVPILQNSDYSVQLARLNNGFEKVREKSWCSVVVLDWQAPILAGAQVFREIRKAYPGLPIIVTSPFQRHQTTFAKAGGKVGNFFKKPFDQSEFLLAISIATKEG